MNLPMMSVARGYASLQVGIALFRTSRAPVPHRVPSQLITLPVRFIVPPFELVTFSSAIFPLRFLVFLQAFLFLGLPSLLFGFFQETGSIGGSRYNYARNVVR